MVPADGHLLESKASALAKTSRSRDSRRSCSNTAASGSGAAAVRPRVRNACTTGSTATVAGTASLSRRSNRVWSLAGGAAAGSGDSGSVYGKASGQRLAPW